ncbi:carbon storage regulator homolog [Striga asiatica]|uniref:Carbon storage regulator homolog n=1 Tax=Striga asiatica TaxID=4170 RepID=A0A5A7QL37_STRAF|nr:carbon storage regulator homolog [Striga asiatica]
MAANFPPFGANANFTNVEGINEGDDMPLHPQFTLMLQNIQAEQQNIQVSLNGLSRKLDATIQICSARSINQTIIYYRNLYQNFEVLPKQYPNHPWANPPRQLKGFKVQIDDDVELQVFQIDGDSYEVGDNPPVGLIPANLLELDMIRRLELADFQSWLRGIYWFYNGPKLSIPTNADINRCFEGLYNLKSFLQH